MDTRKPFFFGVFNEENGALISKHRDMKHARKSLRELSKQDRYFGKIAIRNLYTKELIED